MLVAAVEIGVFVGSYKSDKIGKVGIREAVSNRDAVNSPAGLGDGLCIEDGGFFAVGRGLGVPVIGFQIIVSYFQAEIFTAVIFIVGSGFHGEVTGSRRIEFREVSCCHEIVIAQFTDGFEHNGLSRYDVGGFQLRFHGSLCSCRTGNAQQGKHGVDVFHHFLLVCFYEM